MSNFEIEILIDIGYFFTVFKSHKPSSVCGFFHFNVVGKSISRVCIPSFF
jgi:hypothetical protein